ncbi:hypothetical protein GGI20_003970 [Coemansia sp. BCRC 34301]|nr:hypothetical protein GGI20_003970 [Coemansia sp. BCRC 34301]
MRELVCRVAEHLASAKETILFAMNIDVRASKFADWADSYTTAVPQDTRDAVAAAADAAFRQLDEAKLVYADRGDQQDAYDHAFTECSKLEIAAYRQATAISGDTMCVHKGIMNVRTAFTKQHATGF